MTENGKKRRYPDSFKQQAVAMLVKSGKPVSEIAVLIGVERSVLQKWKKRYGSGETMADNEASAVFAGRRELTLLKRELRLVRDDVEQLRTIIKKSYTLKYLSESEEDV
ncbi:MAG TPA: transposase [Chitinivibrionales bacterium]